MPGDGSSAPASGERLFVDLSGDFRLRDAPVSRSTMGPSTAPWTAQTPVCLWPDGNESRSHQDSARRANPGCFAPATLLGLAPLVANNVLTNRVIVDAKTGSSGSGAKPRRRRTIPSAATRSMPTAVHHQHVPEIEQELTAVGEWNNEHRFHDSFAAGCSGIFASIYTETKRRLAPPMRARCLRSLPRFILCAAGRWQSGHQLGKDNHLPSARGKPNVAKIRCLYPVDVRTAIDQPHKE